MPSVPSIEWKPLYAIAGAGNLAVEHVRARVIALPDAMKDGHAQVVSRGIDLTGRAQSQVTDLRRQASTLPADVRRQASTLPAGVRKHAETLPGGIRKQAETLPADVRRHAAAATVTVRKHVEVLPADLRRHLGGLNAKAIAAYEEFAKRGEQKVTGLRGGASPTPNCQ